MSLPIHLKIKLWWIFKSSIPVILICSMLLCLTSVFFPYDESKPESKTKVDANRNIYYWVFVSILCSTLVIAIISSIVLVLRNELKRNEFRRNQVTRSPLLSSNESTPDRLDPDNHYNTPNTEREVQEVRGRNIPPYESVFTAKFSRMGHL